MHRLRSTLLTGLLLQAGLVLAETQSHSLHIDSCGNSRARSAVEQRDDTAVNAHLVCQSTDRSDEQQYQLSVNNSDATLQFSDRCVVFSMTSQRGNIMFFSDLHPGTDDERVETLRQLRWNRETGLMTFFEHQPRFVMLEARCKPATHE